MTLKPSKILNKPLYNASLNHFLPKRALITPFHPALIYHDQILSFSQLHDFALQRAKQLLDLGIGRGDIVALLLENTPLFVELLHAVPYVGATLLLLNTRLSAEELTYIIEETKAKLLIHDKKELVGLTVNAVNQHCLATSTAQYSHKQGMFINGHSSGFSIIASNTEDKYAEVDPSQEPPMAILYTSGTTGKPKGVPLNRQNFYASALGAVPHLGLNPEDRWLVCMPLYHIGGLSILTRSVITATTVVLHDRFDPYAISKAIDEQKVTLISMVPTMLRRLLQIRSTPPPLRSLRAILLGGGPISSSLLEDADRMGFKVLPTYGLTEACSQVATRPIQEKSSVEIVNLKPLFNIEVRICDSMGETLQPGQEGEIAIRGPMVTAGYWKNPEATAESFRNGWFYTGDIGYLNKEGSLVISGRRSDLIVSGGENISKIEVENTLLSHPDIQQVTVSGEPHEDYGQCVAAWIVLMTNSKVSKKDIQDFCRQKLAGYKIPRRIYFCPQLPDIGLGPTKMGNF